jgi:hypothetical protein
VAATHRGPTLSGHRVELRRRSAHDRQDRIGQRLARPGGDEPATLARDDQLGDTRHVGGEHGATERKGLHDDHGQALGRAR